MISSLVDQISPKFGQHIATRSATYLLKRNQYLEKMRERQGGQKCKFLPKNIFLIFTFFSIFVKQHFLSDFCDYENIIFLTLTPLFKVKSLVFRNLVFSLYLANH